MGLAGTGGGLFGIPPYLIALAVECTEKARVWGVTPSIVPLGAYLSVFEHDRASQAQTTICHFTSNMELY